MKRENKSPIAEKSVYELISELPECRILSLHEMRCIKGGDGEGGCGEPIIIIPPVK